MRIIVHTPDRFDHLLFAMAADAVDLEIDLTFVTAVEELLPALDHLVSAGTPADMVVVHTDGRGAGLPALTTIDRDAIFWPTPTVVLSTAPTDDERLRSYANGARWYQPRPSRFSDAVQLIRRLPERLEAIESGARRSVIDLAAADLVDEIESFLLSEA